jgi:hypothetical protein
MCKPLKKQRADLQDPPGGILAKYAKGCTRPSQKMQQMPEVLKYHKAPTR